RGRQRHQRNCGQIHRQDELKENNMANTAVFGIYRDRAHVETGVDTLVNAGFRSTDISVLLPENVGTKDFAHEKNTKAPEGVTRVWLRRAACCSRFTATIAIG